MTVHASKGLEFDGVFIAGLEQDLFPHKGKESDRKSRDNEEERRLFYVAVTRARKKLCVSYTKVRTLFGSRQTAVPSEFVFDIPEEHIEREEKFEGGGKIVYLEI
jgi:DNA helicase-2/ATP-dependent DNA helicase PcrA